MSFVEVNVVSEKENPLLKRKEITFEIKGIKATPSRNEIIKQIAAMKNAEEEKIVITEINQLFGKSMLTGTLNIYDDKETMRKIEPEYLMKRGKKEEKAEKEAPKEEKEKPTEEKKEEKKGEKPAEKEEEKKPAEEKEEEPQKEKTTEKEEKEKPKKGEQ